MRCIFNSLWKNYCCEMRKRHKLGLIDCMGMIAYTLHEGGIVKHGIIHVLGIGKSVTQVRQCGICCSH